MQEDSIGGASKDVNDDKTLEGKEINSCTSIKEQSEIMTASLNENS